MEPHLTKPVGQAESAAEQPELAPFTLADLRRLEEDIRSRYWASVRGQKTEAEHVAAERQFYQTEIAKLLQERDRFTEVFRTEQGSIYFVAADGTSWRFKQKNERVRMEPPMTTIVYLNEQGKEKLMSLKDPGLGWQESIFFAPIPTVELAAGTQPLEIGVVGYGGRVVFTHTNNELTIVGIDRTGQGDLDYSFASGLHLGHKVTEIIKKNSSNPPIA